MATAAASWTEGRRAPARTVRLILADPFSVFRLGVRSVIADEHGFEILEAGSLGELERLVSSAERADLALIDLDLPPAGAGEAIALLRPTGIPTVVWSQRARFSPPVVFDLVRVGAMGVLSKEISASGLVRALRGVVHGEAALERNVAWLLIDGMHAATDELKLRSRMRTLSAREREVLDLVCENHSNKAIAAVLCVSEFTAKRHVQNILRKLGVHSRWEAAASYYAFLENAPVATRRHEASRTA